MKQATRTTTTLLILLLAGLAPRLADAQLFTEEFNTPSSSNNWSVVFESASPQDYTAEFGFDYSTQSYTSGGVSGTIPAAPSGSGNTVGVKLTVNNNDATGAAAAVSLFPTGQSFSGNFALRFDMWMNYNGPAGGGSGSTENASFGLNHSGNYALWSAAQIGDGVWFTVTGEGGTGSSGDYQAYVGDGFVPPSQLLDVSAGFLDRDGDGNTEFEVNAGQPDSYPLKQMFPSPDFETAGAPGKNWVQVEVRQNNGVVTWLMDGYVIAEHSFGGVLGQTMGNVSIGYYDSFNSIASPAEENFIIFDNLRVVDLDTETPLPVVSVSASDPFAAEPSDPGEFTISLSAPSASDITVPYNMVGTATSGDDYTALPGSVTILAGQTSTNISLNVLNDNSGEGDETATLALLSTIGVYELRETMATITIADDTDTPSVTVIALRGGYELNPENEGRMRVSLASQLFTDTSVSFTLSGSAVNGTDYSNVTTSVVIPAFQTNAIINFHPIDNSAIDGDRTVTLTVTSGAGYAVGSPSNATITIRDDDLPPGTLVYTEDFDADATSAWTINDGPTDETADFFFDYSSVGIPSAPNSTGGSTRGAKLQANLISATFGGFSVSPTGESFGGDYRLRADVWINFNGPFPDGGSGSTQIGGIGIGTAGTTPQWSGGTQDSVWFAATGDAGSSVDYRAYSSAAATGYGDSVFVAGSRNHDASYYSDFGGEPAPTDQLNLYPQQTGQTIVGSQGMLWRDFVVTRLGNTVTWHIDGKLIATIDLSDVTLGGGNILLVHSDINGSSSSDPNAGALAFSLYDNLRVETLAPSSQPAITGIRVIGDTTVQIDFNGETSDSTSSFTLQSTGTVDSGYGDVSATIIELAPGSFRAEIGLSGDLQFYRVRRN